MNVMTRSRADVTPRAIDPVRLRLAVDLASRTVAPLWPLDGAIAVNPLSGFEDLPFEEAVRAAALRFGARSGLSLTLWRRLSGEGRPPRAAVRDAAIAHLGGIGDAFRLLGPDITCLDCLMARLFDMPVMEEPGPADDTVARSVADLCAAFFDAGGAALPMPGRERGLFAAARHLLPLARPMRANMLPAALPDRPLAAIAYLVERLGVPDAVLDGFLADTVARLPGWAGHIRWRTDHADAALVAGAPAGMADLIALLLLGDVLAPVQQLCEPIADPGGTRAALAAHFGVRVEDMGGLADQLVAIDGTELALIFQRAAEADYRDRLVAALRRDPLPAAPPAAAALVFCIDVRSEPMRRAIEAAGPWETVGYAGFFGLPIAIHPAGHHRLRQLPVLVAPQHDLAMVAAPGAGAVAAEAVRAQARARRAGALFGWLKGGGATAYATAEATGMLAGMAMLANTVMPLTLRHWRRRWRGDSDAFTPSLDPWGNCGGLTLTQRIGYARALFALTGLDPQVPMIVLVGHRGEAVNNPFAAALDCGACAGHGGAPNAQAMAAILNDPAVRAALALPAHGFALAAEHNTTTDMVTLFDAEAVPEPHRATLARLRHDLAAAGTAVRDRRACTLDRTAADLVRGAGDWGEVRPEWGLTGNAAFIVASRARTRGVDLMGRAFLHSYDWRADPDGEALATILTAPMVVAQWINGQYLFATIDNDRYGAGDKATHNPVGRIGVVRGNGGDLAIGLPRQSLFRDDGTPAHVPQRLVTVVEAPCARIDAVIAGHRVLQRLFGNGWVQLVAIDPETGAARRWCADAELPSHDRWPQ